MVRGIRSSVLAAAFAGATFVGVAATTAVVTAPAVRADAVDDRVAQLKEVISSGDEATIAAAVKSLEKVRDKRVDAALMNIVRSPKFDTAAREAMRVLGLHGDTAYVAWVRSKIGDEKMMEERRGLYGAMMDSLPPAGDALRPCLKPLADCVLAQMKTRSDVSTRAVAAYASVRDLSVISGLISMLEEIQEAESSGGSSGRGRQVDRTDVMGRGDGTGAGGNIQTTKDAIIDALRKITGAKGSALIDWKTWWYHNAKTFRFRQPEPDWPTIDSYTDDFCGLVLRKPSADPKWVFEKCPTSGGFARLVYRDGAETKACVDVMTAARGSLADASAFAHVLDEVWRTREFSGFADGAEPATTKRKSAGREFAVLSARGLGAGAWKDWSECERRTYVTMVDPETVLYFEATVRDALPADQKAALWHVLDGLAPKK